MTLGSRSSLRNGEGSLLWSGRWVNSGTFFSDHVMYPEQTDHNAFVFQLVNGLGEWVDLYADHWLLVSQNGASPTFDWSSVWKWMGPYRVHHFLWLGVHDLLLKNGERDRRNLSSSNLCPRCNLGYRKIALQLDSQVAVSILLQDGEVTHKHGTEVLKFRELLSRDWVVKVYHIFREANKVVDFLAVGHDFNFGSHEFDCSTPDFCSIFYMINLASQYPGLS
ncbi:hypothetical protein LINPERHAP2_LOCUS21191 [Linum perenne]